MADIFDSYLIFNKLFNSYDDASKFYSSIIAEAYVIALYNTPYDTGLLMNSYRLVEYGDSPNQVYIENDCPYAVYVHENLTNNHPNGGQAKFLEDAGYEIERRYDVKCFIELNDDCIRLYFDDDSYGYSVSGNKLSRRDYMKKLDTLFASYTRKNNADTEGENGGMPTNDTYGVDIVNKINNNDKISNVNNAREKSVSHSNSDIINKIINNNAPGKTGSHLNLDIVDKINTNDAIPNVNYTPGKNGYHLNLDMTNDEKNEFILRRLKNPAVHTDVFSFEELI